MDYSRIDVLSKGIVWQGGTVDSAINSAPFVGPLLIVCMDLGESNDGYIDHQIVEAVLSVQIQDSPDACLKDEVLKSLAYMAADWLSCGGNIYIHCAAGISRSTYFDIALHCTVLGISALDALAAIKNARPIVGPNPGFMDQLKRLWPQQHAF